METKITFEDGRLSATIEVAVEIATKSVWKYPKNELPKNGSQVVVYCENSDFTTCAEYLFDKFRIINSPKELYNKVIAWCYLPVFNKA